MSDSAIFGPFIATILLTFLVWVFLFVRRVPFIQESGMTPEMLQEPGKLAELAPPSVSNPSDNLKNLFEIPVLFYALVLAIHATGQVDTGYVVAGWVFFAFRAMHSFVHCTFNAVMVRFGLYLVSCLAVWYMAARMAAAQFLGA